MILLLLDIRWNDLTFLVEVSTTWPHPHNASGILLTAGRYLTFISLTYEKTLTSYMSIYFWDKFLVKRETNIAANMKFPEKCVAGHD